MPFAGSVDVAQLDLEVYDLTTAATLAVKRDGVVVASPVVTPVDLGEPTLEGQSWRALVPYPTPGLYWQAWTVTGTGAGIRMLPVAVGPAGPGDDPRHTYATTVELANALHDAPPVEADRLLRDASAAVDRLLRSSRYPVDEFGMPTDPKHIKAIMLATCAVVKWRVDTGDIDGVASLYTSSSVAGVALSRAQTPSGKPDRDGDEARQVLADAGLTGFGPRHGA